MNCNLLYACISMILTALMLSGCFGFIAVYPTECDFDLPQEDYVYAKGDNDWGRIIKKTPEQIPLILAFPKKAELKRLWGSPDEIIFSAPDELIFVYNFKVWCGAVPAFGLPIPLVLKTCNGFDRITFKGDAATHITFKKSSAGGGFIPGGTIQPQLCPPEKPAPHP